jgi:PAS domain S-box-containing protein
MREPHSGVPGRTRAELAKERELQRLNEAQRIGKIGDWEWNLATQQITWSPQVFEILGRDPSLGPPRNHEENAAIFDAASRACMEAKVAAALASGEAQEYELLARRPDGKQVNVHATAVPFKDKNGRVVGLRGTVQDISARLLSERHVRESDERLSFALTAADIGEYSLNLRTNVSRRSLRHDQCFGYSKSVPVWGYDTFLAHVQPVDRDRVDACFQKALAGEGGYDIEFRTAWPDGSVHWLWIKGRFSVDESGEPVRLDGIVLEITERKQLEEGAARLAALVEASEDAIIGKDLRGIVTSWNIGAEMLFGYPASEMIRQSIMRLVPPDRMEEAKSFRAKIARGESVRFETVRVRKDGVPLDVLITISAVRVADGAIVGASQLVRDITAERRTALALAASELRYRRLFETAKDGILILDAETGMVVDVNPFLVTLLGFSHERFLEKAIWELGFFKDLVANRDKFLELREKEYLRYEHLPLENAHGQKIDVEFISNVYLVNGGKVMQCNVRDITARRRAEEALRELSKRTLLAANEERRRIAQELHNSTAQDLAGVMLNLGLLQDLLGSGDKKTGDLLADSIALMERSVSEIRTLSYLVHPLGTDNTGLVGGLEEYVAGIGRRSGIRVSLECPLDFPRLPEDSELSLFRVVQESLSNIVRHSGSDTAVVRLTKEDHRVVLEVTDRGRGLPSGMMDQSLGFRGVGIAAMRERMQHFGGTLEIESSPRGVTIRVALPFDAAQADVRALRSAGSSIAEVEGGATPK